MSDGQQMHHVTVHKQKKPWYARFWVWVGIIILALIIGGALSGGGNKQDSTSQPANNQSQKTEPAATWDMEAAYAKVSNGMTKAEVEAATGKKSDSCYESQTEYLGKTELCSYGSAFIDKGTITVTYSQDKVSSKSKSTY